MIKRPADIHFYHPAIAFVGRMMFVLIFFLSGVTHFTDMAGYVSLMPEGIPFREFWVIVSAIVELLGAILILTNRAPRLGAWMIVLFLIPVTIAVHGYGILAATEPRMAQIQTSFFLKGITMTGAALLITQLGVRREEASPLD